MTDLPSGARPQPSGRLYLDRPSFWPGVVLLLVGLAFGSVGLWHLYHDLRLSRGGVTTTGQIDNSYSTTTRRRDGGLSYRHYMDVSFRDAAGQLLSAVFLVSREYFIESRGQSGVELRYVAANPAIAEIEQGRSRRLGSVFGLIGGTILWIGLLLLGATRRQAASRRRAAEAGEARSATVTSLQPAGKKTSGKARLHWSDSTGLTGIAVARPVAELPPPGSTVTVYVDPQRGQGYWSGDY